MTYKIEWVGCNPANYEVGGATDPKTGVKYKPIAIVNHIMQGSLSGTIQWFNNPASQASTNYSVGRNGRIVQHVKEGVDRPFANGYVCKDSWKGLIRRTDGSIVNPNRYTVSIEHEGFSGDPFTEEMYQATLWLQKKLLLELSLPVNSDTIIGHYNIDSCNKSGCPGPAFPWDRLMKDLLEWETQRLLTWEQKLGLDSVASLASKRIINNPDVWTATKMTEPAPTWLLMALIDRLSK